jgi:hypothetical protein
MVLQNGAGFGGGRVGQGLSLDGSNDFASAGDGPALRPQSLTLEGWFRFDTDPGIEVLVSKTLGTGTNESYVIYTTPGFLHAAIGDPSGVEGPEIPFHPVPETWYHIAMTFDDAGNRLSLYVDGALAASVATSKTIAYDSHPLMLGAECENESLAFFFDGSIDELALYDRALSGPTIDMLYHAYRFGKCAGPVGVDDQEMPSPRHLSFRPTPFSSAGHASFDLTERSRVHVCIYDAAGRRVVVLADRVFEAGSHALPWDGRDSGGGVVRNGVYFVRLESRGTQSHAITKRSVPVIRVR